MNYLHDFHAGNAADVFKHAVLLALLEQFKQKDKAFCYVDLYAGAGIYNLNHHNQEWREGVGSIQSQKLESSLLKQYQTLTADISAYPGSPVIARHCLRSQDQLIAIEKNDKPGQRLKDHFFHDKQAHVHIMDAQTAIKALLPPAIRRGIVLIDPPYEDIDEFNNLTFLLESALQRWSTVTYLLWYPIKSRQTINKFHRNLQQNITVETSLVELCLWPDDVPARLNGSGLIVVNPPWQFENILKPFMQELLQCLKQHEGAKWQYDKLI